MGSVKSMMGAGLPGAAAVAIGAGSIELAKTATGSTSQANSYAIVADTTEFTTAAANSGARLPDNAEVGSQFQIFNAQASNAMFVYPHVGGTINGLSANAKVDIAASKGGVFTRISGTKWGAVYA